MRYGQIRKYDVANGLNIRTTLFVIGCFFNCYGCFNNGYQSFESGELWTQKQEDLVLQYLADDNVGGFSLLGGEVFHQEDFTPLIKLLKRIKLEQPNKDIWVWSGFTFDELIKDKDKVELLKLCDVLIDGQFVEVKKDLTLSFRGSSNQNIVLIKESLKQGETVLYSELM